VFLTDAHQAGVQRRASRCGWPPFLVEAPLTSDRLRENRPLGRPFVYLASTQTLEPPSGDAWLAIGDAAIGRDPISGSGVDFAFASAEIAAEAIVSVLDGNQSATAVYAELIRRDFAAYLEERRTVYALETRWPRAPFWQARAGSSPCVTSPT
jgi:2-polyprenyl-6-methoxyphenol hydroxylase-like FAD-dependent oxidoreductase